MRLSLSPELPATLAAHLPAAVPLWLPLGLLGIPTALLWWLDGPPRPGHCQNCGYNLTGNTSGRCPECGERV